MLFESIYCQIPPPPPHLTFCIMSGAVLLQVMICIITQFFFAKNELDFDFTNTCKNVRKVFQNELAKLVCIVTILMLFSQLLAG